MDFAYFASSSGVIGAVNAIGVIAKGEAKDVIARGLELSGGKAATTSIELQASDYATAEAKSTGPGSASVTEPGTNGNITALPLLAEDAIHQLPNSPTIDKGAVDGASATVDIDEQAREIGLAPDIGADELGNPTTTSVSCNPASLTAGSSTCLVAVEDVGTALTQPAGTVSITSTSGLTVPSSCTPTPVNEARSTCSVVASTVAGVLGGQSVTATYGGDSGHEGSKGSGTVTIEAVPAGGGGSTGGGNGNSGKGNPPPNTQLKKHPGKQTTKLQAKFTFTSTEAGSRFECKLDKKPFRACVSPFKKKVGLGAHKFQVRAVDAQGKADPSPAVFSWRVVRP